MLHDIDYLSMEYSYWPIMKMGPIRVLIMGLVPSFDLSYIYSYEK